MAQTFRFQHYCHFNCNGSCRYYQYGCGTFGLDFGAHPDDWHTKSIGCQQLDGAKNISIQRILPHCSRIVLGQFYRYWFTTDSKIFWHYSTQSRKLLCQRCSCLSQLDLYFITQSRHCFYLFARIIDSFLHYHQNISCKSHSVRLGF